jgi:hypothetical protein
MVACVPSQKGLLAEPPQRHRRAAVTRSTVRPVPAQSSRLPRTRRGPFFWRRMSSTPPRAARGSERRVAGSPVATKPMLLWLPSQKGLFWEAPQRQRVARKPAG